MKIHSPLLDTLAEDINMLSTLIGRPPGWRLTVAAVAGYALFVLWQVFGFVITIPIKW